MSGLATVFGLGGGGGLLLLVMLPVLATGACLAKDADRAAPPSAAQASTPRAPPPPPTRPPSPDAPPDQLGRLAQLTLDAPALQPYFHEKDRPERSPLVVTFVEAPEPPPRLVKFGKPVVVEPRRTGTARDGSNEPALEFQRIAIEPTSATVQFTYPIEGLVGTATFTRNGTATWHLKNLRLVER